MEFKIRKTAIIFLLIGIFVVNVCYAQVDSIYIQSLSHLFSVKVGVNNEIEGFDLEVNDINYQLYPNTSLNNTYTISYRFLTLSYSFAPNGLAINSDSNEKGKTVSSQFGTEIRKDRVVQSINYLKTQGYYLRNTNEFDPDWIKGDPYIQFPNLNYTEFSGITLFKVNPNLSLASLTAANTRQLKSVFSFTPNILYRYYVIDDQSSVINGAVTQKSNNFDISLSPGFVNTFVFKENLYLSTGLFPGIGRISTKLTTRSLTNSIESTTKTWLYRSSFLTGLGFDNGRFYAGTEVQATILRHTSNDGIAKLNEERLTFELFFGYRFDAPLFLRRSFNAIEEIIPFF